MESVAWRQPRSLFRHREGDRLKFSLGLQGLNQLREASLNRCREAVKAEEATSHGAFTEVANCAGRFNRDAACAVRAMLAFEPKTDDQDQWLRQPPLRGAEYLLVGLPCRKSAEHPVAQTSIESPINEPCEARKWAFIRERGQHQHVCRMFVERQEAGSNQIDARVHPDCEAALCRDAIRSNMPLMKAPDLSLIHI